MSSREQENDFIGLEPNYTSDPFRNDTYNPRNDTYNPNDAALEEKRRLYLYATTIIIFFCIASILINIVILSTLCWIRRPLSPTLQISLYLTGADMYLSFIFGFGLILNSALPAIFGVEINKCFLLALEAFRLGGMFTTMGHLIALSLNHYLGITTPLRYPFILTSRNILLGAILLWIVPTGSLLIYFATLDNDGFSVPNCKSQFILKSHFRIVCSNIFLLCLTVMALIYFHIYLLVKRHQTNRNRFRAGSTYSRNPQAAEVQHSQSRNEKAFKTTFLIISSVVLGWLPATLSFLLVCDDCLVSLHWGTVRLRVLTNTLINSCIIIKTVLNSYIYAARMHEIKSAMKRMRVSLRVKCCLVVGNRRRDRGRFDNSELSRQYLSRSSTRRSKRTILCRLQSLHGHNNGTLRTEPRDEFSTQL